MVQGPKSKVRGWKTAALVTGFFLWMVATTAFAAESPPRAPASISAADHPWDDGTRIDVTFELSPDYEAASQSPKKVEKYIVERSEEPHGRFEAVATIAPDAAAYKKGKMTTTIEKCRLGEPYYFRVLEVAPNGTRSAAVATSAPTVSSRQWFDGDRIWQAGVLAGLCGAIIFFIARARGGKPVKVRKIAALDAIEEAIGRATEMGSSCLYINGIQDLNDMQTVAGINVLSRVAKIVAEYDAKIEIPTSRSLVMTAARETVQAAYLAAGRPDAYVEDNIYYVTDEQFGFASYATGKIARDKPAACFYMGVFFAESLLLAETANSIGAIQIAGTAEPAQLPFFVAACDYTLIGEEFFAASAYLSGDADQLGSLQGQDLGKVVAGALIIVGSLLATVAVVAKLSPHLRALAELQTIVDYLRNTVLK